MSERPRDKNGRYVVYVECKKKQCVGLRKSSEILKNQVKRLNAELEKSEKRIITPLGAFFGFLALFAIITLIFVGLSK